MPLKTPKLIGFALFSHPGTGRFHCFDTWQAKDGHFLPFPQGHSSQVLLVCPIPVSPRDKSMSLKCDRCNVGALWVPETKDLQNLQTPPGAAGPRYNSCSLSAWCQDRLPSSPLSLWAALVQGAMCIIRNPVRKLLCHSQCHRITEPFRLDL